MSSESILFDFADENTLLSKDNMTRLLIAVAEGDAFQFLKKAIVCDDSPGINYVPNSPETLANAWNNAIRARQRYNGYWMEFENAAGLRFSFGFDPDAAQRLFLSAKKADLRNDDNLRAFVRIGEVIFNTLRPMYGFGLFSYDVHETPEIAAPIPAALWDINFFSYGLVQDWGRETLASLPVWREADIGSGGLLLELSQNPITRPQITNYREASAALGFARYFQGG
ncbi:MAG: hypothetical protein GC204_17545 [Chloroflexi bacterium]|nr:hypothetical protein [Chloroflexota bacterium]